MSCSDSKKELSLYLPESYYLQKMLIIVENTDKDLDHVQLWCVCVLVCVCTPMCVAGSWRERERGKLLLLRKHCTLFEGIKAQTQMRVGSGRHIGPTGALSL